MADIVQSAPAVSQSATPTQSAPAQTPSEREVDRATNVMTGKKHRTQDDFFAPDNDRVPQQRAADEKKANRETQIQQQSKPQEKKTSQHQEPQPDKETKPDQPEAPQATKKKFKVNGKDIELDEAGIERAVQRSLASDERFKQAAEIEKRHKALEANPHAKRIFEAVQQGRDLAEVAEEIAWENLQRQAEWDAMTPREQEAARRASEAEQKAIEYQKKLEEIERPQKEREAKEADYKAAQELETELSTAISELQLGEVGPGFGAIWLHQMLAHQGAQEGDNGGKLTAKEAATYTKRIVDRATKDVISKWTVEDAMRNLPKQLLDGIRKAQVKRVLEQTPFRGVRQTDTGTTSTNEKKPKTQADFFDER